MVSNIAKKDFPKNPGPRLDKIFSALSDGTRREMLRRLSSGTMTVKEIGAPFPISSAAVCKHVKVLEEAGFIRREITGRAHRCSLQLTPLMEMRSWMQYYENFWESALDSLESFVKERKDDAPRG